MKKIVIILALAFAFVSCTPYFYQVYKTSFDLPIENGNLVYEDQNVKVLYNFWSDKGNIGFSIYNKTDGNVYVNMGESYFILNGYANNYYRNRVFEASSSGLKSTTFVPYSPYFLSSFAITASQGTSVSFIEEKVSCIPSKTTKHFSEYSINSDILRNCELIIFPQSKKQTVTVKYSFENSPLVFSNRIAYSLSEGGTNEYIRNEFFVSEVTNYPESEILKWQDVEKCEVKSKTLTLKGSAPYKFYLKYSHMNIGLEDGKQPKH